MSMLSRLLIAFVGANVILAGAVLWRAARPGRVRWVIATVTVYGVLSFGAACLSGLTLQEALAGGGLFQFLPRVLRGAGIGAFVILPLGCIISVVRAGIPRFRAGSPRRALYRAVALTTSVVLVAASVPRSATTAEPPSDSSGTS
jgi:hypothetical protein